MPKKGTTTKATESTGTVTRSQAKSGTKKEAKRDPVPIETGKIETLFENLKKVNLEDIAKAAGVKVAKSRQKTTAEIVSKLSLLGEKILIDQLGKEELKSVLEDLGETVDHDNKSKMVTSVKEHLKKLGQKPFFTKVSTKVLDKVSSVLGFEEEGEHADKVNGLLEELIYNGAKQVFDSLKKEDIVEIALQVDVAKTGTKEDIITKIIGKVFPQAEDDTKKDDKKEKDDKKKEDEVEKKPIAKGVTKEDLYQYYSQELQDYCKANNLKKGGTKRDMVKRILAFLDGDVESTKAQKPGEAARKRAEKKETQKRKREEMSKQKKQAKEAAGDKEEPSAKKAKTA